MSDLSVATALRSSAPLVVVEAPAGCGKTFQGAQYARAVAGKIGDGRTLVLTHTHAACDAFASGTRGADGPVEIRTIDSLIGQIAAAYHQSLELPADVGAWARTRKDGYHELATRVAKLLHASPIVPRSLAKRYPVVICDEHQDASVGQHAVVMACHEGGALVRIFGDPMQGIYGGKKKADIEADTQRWEGLRRVADTFDELDEPHRWSHGGRPLGQWILAARATLRDRGQLDLKGPLPQGVSIIVAENLSPKQRGRYFAAEDSSRPIYALAKAAPSLLVLAAHNDTVAALRAFFGRRLPIWEGHVRENLSTLVAGLQAHKGRPTDIARAVITFINHVATGFSPSAFGDEFLAEVSGGCVLKRRGKPATLQSLGRILVDHPDHKGVALMLDRLSQLAAADLAFKAVKVDYCHEFWDAVRLGQFDDVDEGLAEISRRRTYARPSLPNKAISTIHKAKGLECSDVLIMPCDAQHFRDSPGSRRRLYVAMSRATRSLTLVVSRRDPSPLVIL